MIKLHDVKAVADMLGLSISCVYKKAERYEIQAFKIGTALRFSDEAVQDYLEKCRMGGTQTLDQKIDYDTLDNQAFR